MNVTVFCGSRPNEADYAAAYRLGQLLAAAGHTVISGGYIGGMEAVSRGAMEAGGQTVGVTCDAIEAWRPVQPNAWLCEERRFPSLRERLYALIEGCDAAIALPGGPGTLTEIAMLWNHLVTEAITPRKLILVGAGWQAVFATMYRELGAYTPEEQRRWLLFAPDVDAAMAALNQP